MHTTARSLLALLVVGSLVAACGSNQPATTATQGPVATPSEAPASQPASVAPTDALPSFAMPSFTSAKDLEDMLPDQIAGQAVVKFSATGSDFMGGGGDAGSEAFGQVLGQFGKTPADLTIAFGSAGSVTVIAYRIKDVPASAYLAAFVTALQAELAGGTITDVNVGGKAAKKFVSAEGDTSYIYFVGDVLFVAGGDPLPDAVLNEIFSKLP